MPLPVFNATFDELQLAWRRVRIDRDTCRFLNHPYVLAWLEADLDGFLGEIQVELSNEYVPRAATPCWVPKPRGQVRPGTILDVKDEVVYAFLVGRVYDRLHENLKDLQGDPDVAYRLPRTPDQTKWVKSDFAIWREWRTRSERALEDAEYGMLQADITGFYDNIDINMLMSDVRDLAEGNDVATALNLCLRTWSHPRDRGIPQGYSASHLLAKLHLASVDQALVNDGFVHLRYVDDLRVFLNDEATGRMAILRLTDLLHRKGLSLQSAKTEVVNRDEALRQVSGVAPIISAIKKDLVAEIEAEAAAAGSYVPSWEIDRILLENEGPPPEVLERAFAEYYLEGDKTFDKTLFRYLLNRLGKARSYVAVEFCLKALDLHPEETENVLRYLGAIDLGASHVEALAAHAGSASAIYDHQIALVVRWFFERREPTGTILALCRALWDDANRPHWLKSYALAYLGRFGDPSDRGHFEARLLAETSDVVRGDLAVALGAMEPSRRNAALARIASPGALLAQAIAMAKRGA